jgi:ribonuclease P protein component
VNKRYRLRNNADFEKVYKYGRSLANKYLVLKYKKADFSLLRFGFSVSKKYGKAVLRNRIKRQLKDIVQKRISGVKSGYDIVFLVRQESKSATYAELVQAVDNLLKRAKVIEDV